MADPAKEKYDKLQVEVGTKELEAKKAKMEKDATDEAERIAGNDRVLIYSVYDNYHLGKSAGTKKREVDQNDRVRYVDDGSHSHHQFRSNRCWVKRSDLKHMRTQHFYGYQFIEAIDAKDGDENAISLHEILDTERGVAWLEQMERNSKNAKVMPPLKALEIRQEITGLLNGKVKPPVVR